MARFTPVLALIVLSLAAAGGFNQSTEEGQRQLDQRFFLKRIFDKYGHDGVMSFEGFEHLLESLGLAHFDKRHSVAEHRTPAGIFREVHDARRLHNHSHPPALLGSTTPTTPSRHRRDSEGGAKETPGQWETVTVSSAVEPQCLSPSEMLVAFGLEASHGVAIDATHFQHLCPVIVYELDQRSCTPSSTAPTNGPVRKTHSLAWALASVAVLIVSAVGLAGAWAGSKALSGWKGAPLLTDFLVATGASTLFGDALMHLLPHALSDGGGELRAAAAVAAICFFFVVEKMLNLWKNRKSSPSEQENQNTSINGGAGVSHGAHGHSHSTGGHTGVASVVYMVIVGDGLHNLTDGLAIGAAFAADPVTGCATALAVLFHELPHEFGDFAVLLRNGMRVGYALLAHILSSVLSFAGMGIGIWAARYDNATLWVYTISAGVFLYIALADMIPELNRGEGNGGILHTILQFLGLFLGGGIMLLIAVYEDSLRMLFTWGM